MGNLGWELNTLAKFCLDMITLTVSKDRICLLVWKKEKLFRASLNKMVMQLKRKKIHLRTVPTN